MVRAWAADVSPLCREERYRYYYEKLPEFRRRKADALRIPEMKAQSAGAWILWERIRAEYGLRESAVFNLSHSGSYVMCAVSLDGKAARVGCDLEQVGQLREKVAERFFCPEEYETIMGAGTQEERTERFYRYWVLKESFMKATGKGMALAADSFCIRLGEPPVLVRQPEEFPEQYYYMEYRQKGMPYKMAVCSSDGEIDGELYMEFRL